MLIGFRAWIPRLDSNSNPILKSFVADHYWEGPVCEGKRPLAQLDKESSFYSSEKDEGFGFFSLSEFNYLAKMLFDEDMEDSIMGVVQPYGLVQNHRDGYRSERAQVVALCDHVKCALGSCDESVDMWIVHNDDMKMTGVCSGHTGILNATWMKSLCGDNPRIIEHSQYMKGLSIRYHCDIIKYNEFINSKENYGSWRAS